jgi:hypothetical protein
VAEVTIPANRGTRFGEQLHLRVIDRRLLTSPSVRSRKEAIQRGYSKKSETE